MKLRVGGRENREAALNSRGDTGTPVRSLDFILSHGKQEEFFLSTEVSDLAYILQR